MNVVKNLGNLYLKKISHPVIIEILRDLNITTHSLIESRTICNFVSE